jgi:CBS domain-containing protein
MKLSDLMNRDVHTISGHESLRQAARCMREHDIGVLPVCTGDRIAGMLTDRDIVVRGLAGGGDPDKARVSDAMTRDVAWCYEDEEIEEAAQKMSDRQIQRLAIVDRSEKLVGILSLGDVARARESSPGATRVLQDIKAPTKPSAVDASSEHARH